VLDLGCGDGALTVQLVKAGAAVVGVDASEAQVRATAARGLDALVMNGAGLGFAEAFDVVFSNAALHWMRPPAAVVAGVARSLRPGGWFVAELGGAGNVATLRRALHAALAARGLDAAARDPWYFPTPAAYGALLATHGFKIAALRHYPRPTPLPTGITGWLGLFAAPFLVGLPPRDRDAVLEEVAARVRATLQQPDGRWEADYVRLRFAAQRSGS
jgi:trans-aconitate methyltransferase